MNKIQPLLFSLLILLNYNCASDSTTTDSTNEIAHATKNKADQTAHQGIQQTAILIFKKEKEIEVWKTNEKTETYKITLDANFPIGVFSSKDIKNGIEINFPNEFYKSKKYQLEFDAKIFASTFDLSTVDLANTLIYVFPNDARKDGNFVADFSSPHWSSELYAKMEFHLKEFK